MFGERVYNFAAGPSVLPEPVLLKAQKELLNYGGSGMSVMEMSHRSKAYQEIFDSTKQKLRRALDVPDTHEILFLQGGATLQFASVPMNLMALTGKADYAVTGNFSGIAAREAEKYGSVHICADTSDCGHSRIPTQAELTFSEGSGYFHYCENNTIYGTEWHYVPETELVRVCDMSSNILSKPVTVSDYGLIYAGAQKNMAPAGLTVVIVDKALAGHALPVTPKLMDYKTLIEKDSMLNTPPCWCIYVLGLTLDWLEQQGGVTAMAQLRKARSELVYDALDNSTLFRPHAETGSRSAMNVCFSTGSAELDAEFVSSAAEKGLVNLKGHRLTGGIRASMYNAMPYEAAEALVKLIREFEVKHHV